MDRTLAPEIKSLKEFALPQGSFATLANGINFHQINNGDQPILRLEVAFNAGSKYDKKPGVSFLTSKMIQEGTEQYSASSLQDAIAGLGAFIEVQQGVERINLTFYLLTRNIEEFLPILEQIMHKSIFPRENFQNIVNISKNNIKVNLQKNSVLASQEFKKLVFGENHYYGTAISEENLDEITIDDVTHFYENRIKSSFFEVFAAGKLDEVSLQKLTSFFTKLNIYKKNELITLTPNVAYTPKFLIDKPEALQSSLRIGKAIFNRTHADYFKTLVANEIFGGYFGSRLMKNIREEKGLTYGISSQLVSMEEGGYFVIGTDVKRENTQLALDEIYKELEILKNVAVSSDELNTVTTYMHGSYLGSINSAFAIMDKYKTLYFNHQDYSYYHKYIETLKTITSADVAEMANKYFTELTEVVVGSYK